MLHDGSYKRLFSHRAMIAALAETYLDGDWANAVRWETLKPWATNTVSPGGVQRHNDLVLRVSRKDGSDLYILLMLEFQRRVDRRMIFRMNIYVAHLLEALWTFTKRRPRKLPKVAPVVVYTGREPWTAPTSLAELTPEWPAPLEAMDECDQRMRFLVVSARDAPEAEGDKPNPVDALFRMERSSTKEEFVNAVRWMVAAANSAKDDDLCDEIRLWITRTFLSRVFKGREIKVESLNDVPDLLEQHFDSWAVPFAAEARAKGEAEGWAKGEAEGRAKGEAWVAKTSS